METTHPGDPEALPAPQPQTRRRHPTHRETGRRHRRRRSRRSRDHQHRRHDSLRRGHRDPSRHERRPETRPEPQPRRPSFRGCANSRRTRLRQSRNPVCGGRGCGHITDLSPLWDTGTTRNPNTVPMRRTAGLWVGNQRRPQLREHSEAQNLVRLLRGPTDPAAGRIVARRRNPEGNSGQRQPTTALPSPSPEDTSDRQPAGHPRI